MSCSIPTSFADNWHLPRYSLKPRQLGKLRLWSSFDESHNFRNNDAFKDTETRYQNS